MGANGIGQDVKADFRKSAPFPFFIPQDVVVGLMLETMRLQERPEMFAQEFHPVALIGVAAQAHPEQMGMIGHETIGWANQSLARGDVKHHFPKLRVENFN
jgi:hypothetical protein